MNVASSGGISAHPAGEPAGRSRLHAANADPPVAHHHIAGSLSTPRRPRSARAPEPTLGAPQTSASSSSPCEPLMLRASAGAPARAHGPGPATGPEKRPKSLYHYDLGCLDSALRD